MPSAPTIGESIPAASPASAATAQAMDIAAADGAAAVRTGGILQQAFQQQQQQHSLEHPGINCREDSISLPDIPTASPPMVRRIWSKVLHVVCHPRCLNLLMAVSFEDTFRVPDRM